MSREKFGDLQLIYHFLDNARKLNSKIVVAKYRFEPALAKIAGTEQLYIYPLRPAKVDNCTEPDK